MFSDPNFKCRIAGYYFVKIGHGVISDIGFANPQYGSLKIFPDCGNLALLVAILKHRRFVWATNHLPYLPIRQVHTGGYSTPSGMGDIFSPPSTYPPSRRSTLPVIKGASLII